MPKPLPRIVALLLVPAMLLDPATASALMTPLYPAPVVKGDVATFQDQALMLRIAFWRRHPEVKAVRIITSSLPAAAPGRVAVNQPLHPESGEVSPVVVVADKIDIRGLGIPGVADVSKSKDKGAEIIRINPDILIVRSATRVEADLMKLLPNLKVIIRAGHGTDNVDTRYAKEHGIRVLKTGGSQEPVTALVMRMIARAAQGDARFDRDEAPPSFYSIPDWQEALGNKIKPEMPPEQKSQLASKANDLFRSIGGATMESLKGKKIGIIGFGVIARQIAAVANALGMDVWVYSPSLAQNPQMATEAGYRLATPEEMFRQSHFVVLMSGLNKEGPRKNVHMIDDRVVDLLMANSNFIALINADRGELVEESAMARLLTEKRGAQYLVDDVPMNTYLKERALYTPHIGASTMKGEMEVVRETANLLGPIYKELSAAAPEKGPGPNAQRSSIIVTVLAGLLAAYAQHRAWTAVFSLFSASVFFLFTTAFLRALQYFRELKRERMYLENISPVADNSQPASGQHPLYMVPIRSDSPNAITFVRRILAQLCDFIPADHVQALKYIAINDTRSLREQHYAGMTQDNHTAFWVALKGTSRKHLRFTIVHEVGHVTQWHLPGAALLWRSINPYPVKYRFLVLWPRSVIEDMLVPLFWWKLPVLEWVDEFLFDPLAIWLIKRGAPFITPYAMMTRHEDYAESYGYYALHRDEFMGYSEDTPLLRDKIVAMRIIFEGREAIASALRRLSRPQANTPSNSANLQNNARRRAA